MILAAVSLLLAASPAAPAPAKPKLVCRTQETTGSLAGAKKVCMTREDWAKQYDKTQQAMNGMQDHTTSCARDDFCQ